MERLHGVHVVLAVGTDDEFRSDAALGRHRAWLEAGGVRCRLLEYPGGHRVEPKGLARLVDSLVSAD